MTNMLINKIAQKIADRSFFKWRSGLGLRSQFFDKDRDRNRDLNFGDRAHALRYSLNQFLGPHY